MYVRKARRSLAAAGGRFHGIWSVWQHRPLSLTLWLKSISSHFWIRAISVRRRIRKSIPIRHVIIYGLLGAQSHSDGVVTFIFSPSSTNACSNHNWTNGSQTTLNVPSGDQPFAFCKKASSFACWTNIFITMAAWAVEMLYQVGHIKTRFIQKILTCGQACRNNNIK